MDTIALPPDIILLNTELNTILIGINRDTILHPPNDMEVIDGKEPSTSFHSTKSKM